MEFYKNLKSKFGVYAFEAGVIVGIFIAAYSYNNNVKRNRKYIVDALEHAIIKVKEVD